MKCNRNPNILHNFNQLSVLLQQTLKVTKKIEYKEIEMYVKKVMGKEWNVIDLISFYEYIFDDFIQIHKKKNGEMDYIEKGDGEMKMMNDFNEEIETMCKTSFSMN
jgi:hypothetical protein